MLIRCGRLGSFHFLLLVKILCKGFTLRESNNPGVMNFIYLVNFDFVKDDFFQKFQSQLYFLFLLFIEEARHN
jgi:hypothetical protein